MEPKVATRRFRPGLSGPVGHGARAWAAVGFRRWPSVAPGFLGKPWALRRCSPLRCRRRFLYVEPQSETQPSWPFRSVAAASCRRRPHSRLLSQGDFGTSGIDQHQSVLEKNLLWLKGFLILVPRSFAAIPFIQQHEGSSPSRSVRRAAPHRAWPGGVCMTALPYRSFQLVVFTSLFFTPLTSTHTVIT